MITSELIDKIFPAFIKAQSEFQKAIKNSDNPFFKSKYADLNTYLTSCSDGLTENSLAVMQDTSSGDTEQSIKITTRLIHASGQWIESSPLVLYPTDMKPQSFGSAQTYGRRYSLSSFFGMGAADDDGNHASKEKPAPKRSEWNKKLLACENRAEYDMVAGNFSKETQNKIWDKFTRNPSKKEETWYQLFKTHLDRVSGVNPIDTTQGPEQIQKEWASVASTCQDKDTLVILETQLNLNKSLQTDSNYKLLETLHIAFPVDK